MPLTVMSLSLNMIALYVNVGYLSYCLLGYSSGFVCGFSVAWVFYLLKFACVNIFNMMLMKWKNFGMNIKMYVTTGWRLGSYHNFL